MDYRRIQYCVRAGSKCVAAFPDLIYTGLNKHICFLFLVFDVQHMMSEGYITRTSCFSPIQIHRHPFKASPNSQITSCHTESDQFAVFLIGVYSFLPAHFHSIPSLVCIQKPWCMPRNVITGRRFPYCLRWCGLTSQMKHLWLLQ